MKCRVCDSTEHFAAKCPKGKGGPPPQLYRDHEPSMAWNEWSSSSNQYVSMFSMTHEETAVGDESEPCHYFTNDDPEQDHARIFMNTTDQISERQSSVVSSRRDSYGAPMDMFQFGALQLPTPSATRAQSFAPASQSAASSKAPSEARPWNIYSEEQPNPWIPKEPTRNDNEAYDNNKEKKTYRLPEQYRVRESEIDLPNYSDIWKQGLVHNVPRLESRIRQGNETPIIGTERVLRDTVDNVKRYIAQTNHEYKQQAPAYMNNARVAGLRAENVHRVPIIMQNREMQAEREDLLRTGRGSDHYPSRMPHREILEESRQALTTYHERLQSAHTQYVVNEAAPLHPWRSAEPPEQRSWHPSPPPPVVPQRTSTPRSPRPPVAKAPAPVYDEKLPAKAPLPSMGSTDAPGTWGQWGARQVSNVFQLLTPLASVIQVPKQQARLRHIVDEAASPAQLVVAFGQANTNTTAPAPLT